MHKKVPQIRNSIIIFGGTFAPFHDGHAKICKLLTQKPLHNKLILVPAYKKYYQSASHCALAQKFVLQIINILCRQYKIPLSIVSRFELDRLELTPTHLTIDHFKKIYPSKKVFFLIGDDLLQENIEYWEQFDQFGSQYQFIIMRRQTKVDISKLSAKVADFYQKSIKLNNPYYPQSSTDFRAGKNLYCFHKKLIDYSNKHTLFWKSRLAALISPKRQVHSYNVAKLACFYGANYGINKRKLFFAGIYHDLYKNVEDYTSELITDHLTSDEQRFDKPVWHGFVCASVLKADWHIKDKQILAAIRNHTVPSINATLFEKIIYCADKLSYERKDKHYLTPMRKLAKQDINVCFQKILYYELKILLTKKRVNVKHYQTLAEQHLESLQVSEINELLVKNDKSC